MGCTSIAQPAKKRSVLKCEICFNPYDANERKPMNLPCGHTVCNSCLAQIKSSGHFQCPFDRKEFNCNDQIPVAYTLLAVIEAGNNHENESNTGNHNARNHADIQNNNYEKEEENKVPKNDTLQQKMSTMKKCICGELLKSTQYALNCSQCGYARIGSKCTSCSYHLCFECYSPKPKGLVCPCGHSLKYVHYSNSCFSCGYSRHGTKCESCGYALCFECYSLKLPNPTTCPCGSLLEGTQYHFNCFQCGYSRIGTKCKKCEFFVCYVCFLPEQKSPNICPFGHPMLSVQNTKNCSSCGYNRTGTKCTQCGFFLCYECYKPSRKGNICLCGGKIKGESRSYSCSYCGYARNGIKCDKCGYHLCYECSH